MEMPWAWKSCRRQTAHHLSFPGVQLPVKVPATHQELLPEKWEKEAGGQQGTTEDYVHVNCYSLKWIHGECGHYTGVKGQRINDNCLSNDREATSHLPTLALILSARVFVSRTVQCMKQPCPSPCGSCVCVQLG